MFYSHTLFSRKGPLGTIWIAAYCFKKLKREQIAHTDISSSIDKIMPESQMSYRVLAQLLLGIVRIFSKKVDYLYNDCNEALVYIRKSFSPRQFSLRKGAVTRPRHRVKEAKEHAEDQNVTELKEATCMQPEEAMFAPDHHVTITLPERFELDTFDLGDLDDGDVSRPYELSSPQENILNDDNQDLFLIECHRRETFANEDCSFACFTPVNEVLASHFMDIDLQISEECNLSNVNVIDEGNNAEKGCLHDVEANESSPAKRLNEVVLPTGIMDIDIEISEGCNLSSVKNVRNEGFKAEQGCLQEVEANESSPPKRLNEDNKPSTPPQRLTEANKSLPPPKRLNEANESSPSKRLNEDSEHFHRPTESRKIARCDLKDHSVSVETLSLNHEDLPALVDRESKLKDYTKRHDKSPSEDDLGIPSPKLTVRTPSRKEQRRTSEKRKRIFDEKIVLSNETLRLGIHDASSLVYKRRKAPYTCLDAWRIGRISTLHKSFLDPLIPIMYSKNKIVLEAKSSVYMPMTRSADCNIESANVEDLKSIEVDCLHKERLLEEHQERVRQEHHESILGEHHEGVLEEHQDRVIEYLEAESFLDNSRTGKSYEVGKPDTVLDFMDQEYGSDEKDGVRRDNGWSLRTSSVAKFLLRKFQLEGQKGFLSLGQILQGKTRAKCARLFYETLILKGKDCIDAKQDYPYGDIILSVMPKLEEELTSCWCA